VNGRSGRAYSLPAVLVALVSAAVLAGCSGVPSGSKPHVIATIPGGVGQAPAPVNTPPPGAGPREIVQGFLAANASEDAHHTDARTYLTAAAASKWIDTTSVTVVDSLQTGVPDPVTGATTVSGNKLGTLDPNGEYHPVTNSSGTPSTPWAFQLTKVGGQWRISNLPNGILIDANEFKTVYKPHSIYFLDQNQRQLVPDLRYSALAAQTLCNWLLDQLTAGPPQDLQSANSAVPDQTQHATVTFGSGEIAVDIPGSAELDGQTRLRLAAQLAWTFSLTPSQFDSQAVELTDGSKSVSIPNIANPFSQQSLGSFAPGSSGSPVVYYVRNGAVVDHNGVPIPGQAGTSAADIDAVAIARRSTMLVAATRGKPGQQRLALGQFGGSLTYTDVPAGTLSRPAWAPGLSEVWIGDGTKLLRLPSLGAKAVPVTLAQPSGSVSGKIESVAFSPDGARVALVIANSQVISQVWIGTIDRATSGSNAAAVSIQNLQPITPTGISLTDVAWNDESTLYVIGQALAGFGIWSVQVDGSLLTARPTTNLPGQPDSITASPSGLTWVSVKTTVWDQGGADNAWTAPGGGLGTTLGTNPSYVQ
jgi:Lipoprotein LpqB beta-propeller domain/Sporulation and spore germination